VLQNLAFPGYVENQLPYIMAVDGVVEILDGHGKAVGLASLLVTNPRFGKS
jgi:hypothetical protein